MITHVEIKVSNEYLDPLASPDGDVQSGPLNGGGCNGNNDGFLCVELDPQVSATGTQSWTITFGATDIMDKEEWHLGMRFEWEDGKGQDPNKALLSASAQIPEPTGAVLFALGGVLIVGAQKRRI